jgi:hypothetical protein
VGQLVHQDSALPGLTADISVNGNVKMLAVLYGVGLLKCDRGEKNRDLALFGISIKSVQ